MRGYKWYTIIFLVFIVIVQPSFLDWFSVKGTAVSFVLFFIMLTAFGTKHPDVFLVPLGIGLFYDMLYSPWLGRMTIVLMLAALSVLAVNRFVNKDNMPVMTVFFFIATYLLENIRAVLEVGPHIFHDSFVFIQGPILGSSIYAAVLAAIFGTVFYFQSLIKDKKLGARKSRTL